MNLVEVHLGTVDDKVILVLKGFDEIGLHRRFRFAVKRKERLMGC